MTVPYKDHKFEALQLRYEDQVVLLRTLTEIDHRIITAFFTLQLALGGWLVTQDPLASLMQWGIAVIDFAVAFIFSILLWFNHKRRQEVADTIKNLNAALGFNEPDVYLVGRALNPPYKRRYWFKWYVASVIISLSAVFFVVFHSSLSPIELKCDASGAGTFGIRLEPSHKSASLLLDDGVIDGSVVSSVNRYQLVFPASEGRWETHVSVMRMTGALTWEHGTSPFGSGSTKNVIRHGSCQRLDTSEVL